MSRQADARPRPLFETRRKEDRPLFMVLVALSFLGAVMSLIMLGGLHASEHWRNALDKNISIMIRPQPGQTPTPSTEQADNRTDGQQTGRQQAGEALKMQARKAERILHGYPQIANVTIKPESYTKDLLKPWLGQTALPQDMPLPVLLDVRLKAGARLDTARVGADFAKAGIQADIEAHSRWAGQIRRTLGTLKLLAFLSLALVYGAIGAAAVFASRAAINSHHRVIEVLHQVGAPPSVSARLLSTRLAIFGFKAALAGVLGAIVLVFLARIALSFGGPAGHLLFPEPGLGLHDAALVLLSPFVFAGLIFVLAWRTVMATLNEEIYP